MRRLLVLVLSAALPGAARAQQSNPDSVANACIERDTSTAWKRISQAWSTEKPGAWSNDSLRRVLLALGERDQAVRATGAYEDSMRSRSFVQRMHAQDSIGLATLREIVRRFGWPTKSMVGSGAASAAFLIAQHNNAMHEEALRLMKALPPGEVQASELAMLEDRVLSFSGRPQKYATQLTPQMEFFPIDSVTRVEARRAAVGLPPMDVYLCLTRAITGRAPKFPP